MSPVKANDIPLAKMNFAFRSDYVQVALATTQQQQLSKRKTDGVKHT
ncbi:hypothetical protein TNCV_4796501, partial [Trichonephila clavipes]